MFDFDTPISRAGTDAIKWEASPDAIPMWVADMEFAVPEPVRRAIMDRAAHGIYGYTRVPDEWYAAYISWWRDRHGFTMEKDWLLFATGVVPAITSILRCVTKPGDQVAVMTPVYNHFFINVADARCTLVKCPLSYDGANYAIDWDAMERALSDEKTKAMILCNPHNPVGRIWSRGELIRLGELCAKNSVLVISDEIHCDLTLPDLGYTPFGCVAAECGASFVTCMAPSKAFNLAGLQTAAVCVPDAALREELRAAFEKDGLSMPNVFSCVAAMAAFEKGAPWLDALRECLARNRSAAEERIRAELPEVKCVHGSATYLMWLDCTAVTTDDAALTAYLQEKARVKVNEGGVYGDEGRGFLRVNIACPRSMMDEGLTRLIEGIRSFGKI